MPNEVLHLAAAVSIDTSAGVGITRRTRVDAPRVAIAGELGPGDELRLQARIAEEQRQLNERLAHTPPRLLVGDGKGLGRRVENKGPPIDVATRDMIAKGLIIPRWWNAAVAGSKESPEVSDDAPGTVLMCDSYIYCTV